MDSLEALDEALVAQAEFFEVPAQGDEFLAAIGHGWSGRWTVIVMPASRAADRKELREELTWRGFGELSAGVFAHPEVEARALRQHLRASGLLAKVIILSMSITRCTICWIISRKRSLSAPFSRSSELRQCNASSLSGLVDGVNGR
jgi:hypothetical protein